jgi:hypothetical protein
LRSASRAGSPLLFGLAPRGVCLAAAITGGAVGSYPTFSPLPACVPFVDIPEVFLRAITGSRSAGGLFSVALSVTRFSRTASPGVTRRVALRPQALRPKGILRSPRSGVRTFLPLHVALAFSPASSAQPAIIQLTRHIYYTAQSQFPSKGTMHRAPDSLAPGSYRLLYYPFNKCPRSQRLPRPANSRATSAVVLAIFPRASFQTHQLFFNILCDQLRPAKDESRIGRSLPCPGPFHAAGFGSPQSTSTISLCRPTPSCNPDIATTFAVV